MDKGGQGQTHKNTTLPKTTKHLHHVPLKIFQPFLRYCSGRMERQLNLMKIINKSKIEGVSKL